MIETLFLQASEVIGPIIVLMPPDSSRAEIPQSIVVMAHTPLQTLSEEFMNR